MADRPTKGAAGPRHRLIIEVDVPEGVTDEEVLAAVERVSLAADDAHRDAGGRGLKVVRVEIFNEGRADG